MQVIVLAVVLWTDSLHDILFSKMWTVRLFEWFICGQLVNQRPQVPGSVFHRQQWIYEHEDIGRTWWIYAGCTRRYYWWQHWAAAARLWRYHSQTSFIRHHRHLCYNLFWAYFFLWSSSRLCSRSSTSSHEHVYHPRHNVFCTRHWPY